MMKSYALLAFMILALHINAQNRTNIWELSYSTDTMYPNSEMRYINGLMDTNSVTRIMSLFNTNTSICDTAGNLLFYTNGLTIGNRDYDTLYNAVNFNYSEWATNNDDPIGLSACQGALILPYPDHDTLYYVFHITGTSFFANNQGEVQPLYLSYSVIDMNLDDGMGGVIDSLKNVHIIEDTLTWGRLTACKHANGRDWWVIMHRYYSDLYYKLLVTPDSIYGPFMQHIGSVVIKDIGGQSSFSPDGSKFAMVSPTNILDYMEFDRCNGEFFNNQIINIPDSTGTIGCSFSPNNRFLYVSSKYNLFQYDTWSSNVANSVIHIAAWDSFLQPIYPVPVLFFMHQLAPDNKIYISPFNGVKYLNVIDEPDSLGIACNFLPHSFILPIYTVNIPSFPNYDLDSIAGSDTCNAVYTTQNVPSKSISSFRIAPNPVSGWLNIVYNTREDALFELYDTYGKRVGAISLFHYFKNRVLDISELPSGVYFAAVLQNGKRIWNDKVVVVH
jgi:hypothetical protein